MRLQKLRKDRNGRILVAVTFGMLLLIPIFMVSIPAVDNAKTTVFSENVHTSNDGVTYYRIHEYIFSYVDFNSGDSSYGDWSGSTPTGSLDFGADTLIFDDEWRGDRDDAPKITFKPGPFWEGKVTVIWRRSSDCGGDDNLELWYLDGGSSWENDATKLADCATAHDSNFETDVLSIDHNDGTNSGNFEFGVLFDRAIGLGKRGYIDSIKIETYEFIIEEPVADDIPQQNDQTISVFAYPQNDGFYSNDVALQYRTNSADLDASHTEINYDTQGSDNWYDFTIPEAAYDYNDICYYRIKINGSGSGGWTRYSDDYQTTNFETYDNTDPSFGAYSFNPSPAEYNDSLQFSIDCSEISGDSGISSLRLYLSNSPGVTDSDFSVSTSSSLPAMSGTFEFSLSSSVTDYNSLYFFVRAIDGVGRTADLPEDSITISDSFKPDVNEDATNTDDQNYLDDNYLYFDISEPSDASGVDESSLALEYGASADLSSGTATVTSFDKVGITYNFTIPASAYAGHSTLYYQLSGQDNAANSFATSIKSFDILDLEAPALSLNISESNHTDTPYYYERVKMTFNCTELPSGSGFDQVLLYIRNGSTPLGNIPESTQLTPSSSQFDNYEFIIESSLLSARNDMYWLASAFDVNGNVNNLTGSFTVYDDLAPEVTFSSISPGDSISHNEDASVNYEISDDPNGAGFNTDGSSLLIYYKLNVAPDNGADGTPIASSIPMDPFEGIGTAIIPESVYAYGDTVYYWVNLTDLDSNMDSTFQLASVRSFTVIDDVEPVISIDSDSMLACAYNNSKDINFTAAEPIDAAGLSEAYIYWAVENPSVSSSPGNYDGTASISVSGTGGDYGYNIDSEEIDGIYGEYVYFIITATDSEGNTKTTDPQSFMIDDIILPSLNESPRNSLQIINAFGKGFSVTLWDPDYPTSSGIASVQIYYRVNNSDVGDVPSKYDGIVNYDGSIQADQNTYELDLDSEDSDNWLNDTEVYYFIKVTDEAGNTNASSVGMFSVVEYFDFTITNPTDADPTESEYYYNETQITLDLISGMRTTIYYYLDGQPSGEPPVASMSYTKIISDLDEGYHNITVYYLNEQYSKTLEFFVDLTDPAPIQTLNVEWRNGIARINWELPEDYDTLAKIEIWRSTDGSAFTKLISVDSATTGYSDLGVSPQNSYEYKLLVRDRAGNLSVFSSAVSLSGKAPAWIWIVIAAAVGVGGFITFKVIQKSKRDRSLQELGGMTVDEREELFEYDDSAAKSVKKVKKEHHGPFDDDSEIEEQVWKEVDWKSRAKLKEKIEAFWHEQVDNFVEEALKYEISGDIQRSAKLYRFALRAAERCDDIDLDVFDFLRQKIFSIYGNPIKK